MSRYRWTAIILLCCLEGCASTRTNRLAKREESLKPSSSEIADLPAKSRTVRLGSKRPTVLPPNDEMVASRKIEIASELTAGDDSRIDGDARPSRIRQAHQSGTDLESENPSSATADDSSRVLLTANQDAATDQNKSNSTIAEEESSSTAIEAEKSLNEAKATLPEGYALTLGNVLYLADAQNPNVVFARERINEAYARVDRAQALWLPSIRTGVSYFHHEGQVQDVVGNVFSTNKSSFYGGMGAGSGAGSGPPAVPGLVAQFHFADAIFQPKITGHQAASRQFGATAARNDVLRNTAVAYLELLRAEQALAIAEEVLNNTQKLVDLTGNYAKTGQGLRADYERMLAEKAIREADVVSRIENVRVASARLAQLLHADSSVRISTNEPVVVPLDLLECDLTPASLVATALTRRPELAEQKRLVCEAVERLNREKYAPLVPSVLLGMSYGGFAGGLGTTIANSNDRFDSEAIAYWEIRNLGLGEKAARNETSSALRQSQQRELAIMDQVAREVVESQAQVVERQKRIEISKQSILAAERSYKLNVDRIQNAQGLPIESLQSVQALANARTSYLNAVIDYNIAQFELCRAIGWYEEG